MRDRDAPHPKLKAQELDQLLLMAVEGQSTLKSTSGKAEASLSAQLTSRDTALHTHPPALPSEENPVQAAAGAARPLLLSL